jgi:talin
VDNILTATERLYSTTEDPSEMIRQAKLLAQATSQLVAALTLEAESKRDSEEQRKLLAAAKVLADATSRMVEAAKGCAGSPHSKDQQQQLRVAAEDLREATTVALGVSLKRQVIRRLEVSTLTRSLCC